MVSSVESVDEMPVDVVPVVGGRPVVESVGTVPVVEPAVGEMTETPALTVDATVESVDCERVVSC